MSQRAEMYSLIADIRGRLDELESFVRALPGSVVPSPASFDEPGVESFTPAAYVAFRQQGLPLAQVVDVFERRLPFFQVAAADEKMPVVLESFDLSSLHKTGSAPAFGLEVVPSGVQQAWMTYEFFADSEAIFDCDWTEWILKLSVPEPLDLMIQFVVAGQGFSEKIPHSRLRVTEFASFIHVRLQGDVLRNALNGRKATQLKLLLGTGGRVVPLRVYSFSIFGKR